MHGNVWQLCEGWHAEDYYESSEAEKPHGRLQRGGSWTSDPRSCQSAFRIWFLPDFGVDDMGFRVVLAPALRTP